MGSPAGPNAGGYDALVRKYAPDGDMQWTRQFGTAAWDEALAVTTDEHGNILVAGATGGNLGGPSQGISDVFVRQDAPDGDVGWTHQFATAQFDRGLAIAIDGGGDLIVAGQGVGAHTGEGVTANAGFVRKFRMTPVRAWPWSGRSPPPPISRVLPLTPPATSSRSAPCGCRNSETKAYVLKLTPSGEEAWAVLFGDTSATYGNDIAIDAGGNVILAGKAASYISDRSPPGTEVFTRKLSPVGTLLWDDTFGDSGWDTSFGVAIDGQGKVFTVGYPLGELGGPNLGVRDVFLRKHGP